ncbi:hypothetical protein LINPERHAP1_LOCUS25186, partial [Linum perenne]
IVCDGVFAGDEEVWMRILDTPTDARRQGKRKLQRESKVVEKQDSESCNVHTLEICDGLYNKRDWDLVLRQHNIVYSK